MDRAEWNQERSMLQQENKMLQQQLNQSKDAMVRLFTSVNRVQSSLLIMNGAIAQGYDQLQSKCDNLEKGNSNNSILEIHRIKSQNSKSADKSRNLENKALLDKLKQLQKWSEILLKDDQI